MSYNIKDYTHHIILHNNVIIIVTSLYQNVIITVAFDTTVNVSVGTEELCTIEEPPKREKEVGKKTFHFKMN